MSKVVTLSLIGLAVLFAGCTTRYYGTPATMAYDGSTLDYSKLDQMKSGRACSNEKDANGHYSSTTTQAAKNGGIRFIKHVDTSTEITNSLFSTTMKTCVTVYGE
ncbi:MAG: hypothetical protein AB7E49_08275 [Campylobacterales bacterium]